MGTGHRALGGRAARVRQFVLNRGSGNEPDTIEVTFARPTRGAAGEVMAAARALPDVEWVEAGIR